MAADLQASLLDAFEDPALGSLSRVRRTVLSRGAWIDVLPGWLSGADQLYERLAAEVPWREERRQMYDRVVDVPRLLCFYDEEDPLPLPILDEARDDLSRHYAEELGEPFRTAGLCFYRDGRDSVAWHRDRIAKEIADPIVVLVSLGEPRRFLVRPHGGGRSRALRLGGGDLLVTGGKFQREWEHAVPKVAKAGPRISIAFRHGMVRSSYGKPDQAGAVEA
jgi:alkylated DNA repair dioxygenase AlkB